MFVMVLCFAYGSNMCEGRLKERVPSAKPIDVASLKGYSLKFHKASRDGSAKADASFTGDQRDLVWGVLYEVDAAEKPKLDEAEGLGRGYEEKAVRVTTPSKQDYEAVMYYATSIDASLEPYSWYVRYVVEGAKQHNLPADYVAKVSATKSKKDLDLVREAEERAVRC